jgi:hypothetical protein
MACVFAIQVLSWLGFYGFRGTKLNANHTIITGYKFNALQWRDPDLSPVTKLSWGHEQIAKTMTSLLIIPSVLGFRSILIVMVKVVSFLSFS